MNFLQLKSNLSELLSEGVKCPKCGLGEFWKTRDGRLKCKNCRYLFTPRINFFNVPKEMLEEVIFEFLLEHPIKIILERINISKYKLLKILTILRRLMSNKEPQQDQPLLIKQPIIGIFRKNDEFFAEVVQDIEIKKLKSFIKKQSPLPEGLEKYEAIVFKNHLHRLSPKRYQIDSLERFWGYLKRKLSAKGGVRKQKLPFYLGEYSWRYNHRKLTLKEQKRILLTLVFEYQKFPLKKRPPS